jgi:transcriptional regulator with GAF, ATPase, and Fis domain
MHRRVVGCAGDSPSKAAAALLGMKPSTLTYRMKILNIRKE